ncbi:peptide-binding protein [Coprinopsis cinerea okayama7|uniref:Peptide-binding protein n=1 Tax=Coprinopsis cinerea (strain Okayama-7 / 130 / ATCC MYA-4618 / FGSC 9003) TaxID=240176 RepID=D6RMR6_COPC7|nr:peptide-binding protein [Coprinopsis cinerea okayama7\|eukprot:XP_002911193.1 peptide-binding protein [Coprinopsis cinerea okayama7\
MSQIPHGQMAVPPLPPGWTQHIGPAGQVYYYSAQTQESTYVRPLPTVPVAKKEKAHIKTPIPGTDWLRVVTTEGNVFYSNKVTKQSSWTMPPEIAEAVQAFDTQTREQQAAKPVPGAPVTIESKATRRAEKEAAKRKREEAQPIDEIATSKKAKMEEDDEDEDDDSDDEDSEEEEWQREAAEQLAREAEEEEKRRKEEEERLKKAKEEEERRARESKPQLNMPDKVELSIEEGKALFKTLLREKDINPLLPWDTCLPQFISDPRYVLLPSVTARKEAFDEYCRERARELRESAVKKEKAEANPKEEFDRLLKEEVKSTRTSWTEFRRTWKKDRRFYGWGRDDREREKAFREFLKELGETVPEKRAAAQKAEADFFALLKERQEIQPGVVWKEIKRTLYDDPRYDAVGSSSLREELFNTYIRTIKANPSEASSKREGDRQAQSPEKESKESRRERALREREQKVKMEQGRVSMNIEKSRMGLHQEGGERAFKTMLVDAIRDPQATWDMAVQQLRIDPRFTSSPLSHNQQVKLFHDHIAHLRSKHYDALHALFNEHTPALNTRFGELPVDTIVSSPHTKKLGYDISQVEDEFYRWQKQRYAEARRAFDEMLNENSFVEFWGRLSKMKDVTLDQGLQVTSEDIGEDDEPVSKLNMKTLAETVDIGEMVKVLKRDKRYTDFDYTPEEREQWLRDYLSNLSAPKLSVHVGS